MKNAFLEPEELPEGAKFNGYREYDVQDLRLLRHNIRYLLAEYVTTEGRTITGKLPRQQQGHYGVTLQAFVLYQHCAFAECHSPSGSPFGFASSLRRETRLQD